MMVKKVSKYKTIQLSFIPSTTVFSSACYQTSDPGLRDEGRVGLLTIDQAFSPMMARVSNRHYYYLLFLQLNDVGSGIQTWIWLA